ncbi:MAG: hypothetical protein ACFFDT_18075 [Candidatus Hodarchaeota archaeon]
MLSNFKIKIILFSKGVSDNLKKNNAEDKKDTAKYEKEPNVIKQKE